MHAQVHARPADAGSDDGRQREPGRRATGTSAADTRASAANVDSDWVACPDGNAELDALVNHRCIGGRGRSTTFLASEYSSIAPAQITISSPAGVRAPRTISTIATTATSGSSTFWLPIVDSARATVVSHEAR